MCIMNSWSTIIKPASPVSSVVPASKLVCQSGEKMAQGRFPPLRNSIIPCRRDGGTKQGTLIKLEGASKLGYKSTHGVDGIHLVQTLRVLRERSLPGGVPSSAR